MSSFTTLLTLGAALAIGQAGNSRQPAKPVPARQGTAPQSPLPPLKAGTAPVPAEKPQPLTPEQIERRNKLFASDRWKKIVAGLQAWASTQQIYTPEQLEQIRQTYDKRLLSDSPQQVEQTMSEMEQWLAVVLSPEARQANAYIAQTLALESKQAAEKTRKSLPNVAFMSPAQLEQELIAFNNQRQSDAAAAAAFNQARQQQIQMTQASLAAQQRAQQQALNNAYRMAESRPSYQSPLSPPAPVRRIDYGSASPEFFFGAFGRSGVIYGGHRW